MIVVGALALLLLTAAVVVLFAMVGELSTRIPVPADDPGVASHSDFIAGAVMNDWPEALGGLAHRRSATVLVLSSICSTCNSVADELANYRPEKLADIGVVVSCGVAQVGEDFVGQHSIGHLPHLVDAGGSWVSTNFGVKTSPTALRFQDGVLVEAYSFSRLEPLLGRISTVLEGVS
ncbi:hypothetical protein GCM10009765_69930 [Fodinicola feengrottensis]|uniref:Thioredoxin domain-containing protein n=1 Tax=Fodinicola feengrottensis TaxID=435914 RepID=A0ABP4URP9_9ACTN